VVIFILNNMNQSEFDTKVEAIKERNIILMDVIADLRIQLDPVAEQLENEHTMLNNVIMALDGYDLSSLHITAEEIHYLFELAETIMPKFKFPAVARRYTSTQPVSSLGGITMKKYQTTINLTAGVTTTISTTVTDEPYSILIFDSSLNDITSLIGPMSIAKIGSYYTVYIDAVDTVTNAKLKILY